MRLGAVMNPMSGGLAGAGDEARKRLATLLSGIVDDAHLRWVGGGEAEAEARRLLVQGAEGLLAGGGDGTISAVARVAAASGACLGVLPLGTRNHFSRDLDIPQDIEQAVQVIRRMRRRRVDLAEVNGITFVNNASLGMYPEMVLQRERYRRHKGWRKPLAHAAALWHVLRRFPLSRLTVEVGGRRISRLTPVLFVGNNPYGGGLTADARRPDLDLGKVWLCMAHAHGRLALVRACWGFALGRTEDLPEFDTDLVDALTVHSRHSGARIAIDGEPYRLRSPLQFRSRPAALEVIVP